MPRTSRRTPFNGNNSINDPNTRLAAFVEYVRLCVAVHRKATRIGFAESIGIKAETRTNYGKDIVKVALSRGYVKRGDRVKVGQTFVPGPNVEQIKTSLDHFDLKPQGS
jgi:hypothetical protein